MKARFNHLQSCRQFWCKNIQFCLTLRLRALPCHRAHSILSHHARQGGPEGHQNAATLTSWSAFLLNINQLVLMRRNPQRALIKRIGVLKALKQYVSANSARSTMPLQGNTRIQAADWQWIVPHFIFELTATPCYWVGGDVWHYLNGEIHLTRDLTIMFTCSPFPKSHE